MIDCHLLEAQYRMEEMLCRWFPRELLRIVEVYARAVVFEADPACTSAGLVCSSSSTELDFSLEQTDGFMRLFAKQKVGHTFPWRTESFLGCGWRFRVNLHFKIPPSDTFLFIGFARTKRQCSTSARSLAADDRELDVRDAGLGFRLRHLCVCPWLGQDRVFMLT